MKRFFPCLLVVSLAFALGPTSPTSGEDAALEKQKELIRRKNEALDKGIAWLKSQQQKDGSWDYLDEPFSLQGPHLKMGCTAFCAFALMKAGVYPNDPVIQKAFGFIQTCEVKDTYSVGTVLLALEARQNWESPRDDDSPEEADAPGVSTGEKDGKPKPKPWKKGKPDPQDLTLAQKCVDFLVQKQQANVWRYPMGKTEDSSAAQYALLGLDAGERLGIQVPKSVYEKAQDWFVFNQEKDGPEVAPFAVPGASCSYKDLKAMEKELREKIKKVNVAYAGVKPGAVGPEGRTRDDEVRTVSQDASEKILKDKGGKMRARGWCYTYPRRAPKDAGTQKDDPKAPNIENDLKGWKVIVNGGMTASGLACLFICKSHLEGTPNYEKSLKDPMNAAMRDGAAWIEHNFTVDKNPFSTMGFHHFYYLYGLERAGILGVIPRFGKWDWYDEGCKVFVQQQNSDGKWHAGMSSSVGPVVDTCFALLFLARGTTPVVRLPSRVVITGKGSDEGSKDQPPKDGSPSKDGK